MNHCRAEAHKNYMEELVILKTKMNELTRKTDRGEVIVEDILHYMI